MILNFLKRFSYELSPAYLLWAGILCLSVACTPKKEQILAKVYDEYLYLSDASGIFAVDMTAEDSIKMLNLFVDDWVRDKLFEYEAKKRIGDHDRIEKQVKEYRSSLINYAYQNLIIKERLDSIIDEDVLYNFYKENQESFKLQDAVMRCSFVKIPKTAISKEELSKLWDSDQQEQNTDLLNLCTRHAVMYMLDDSLWNNAEEILLQFPKESIAGKDFPATKNLKAEDDKYLYFLKIKRYLPKGETAPFSQARSKITDIFLLQRKKEVVEKAKDMILEKESRKHNFSIYTDQVKIKSENK